MVSISRPEPSAIRSAPRGSAASSGRSWGPPRLRSLGRVGTWHGTADFEEVECSGQAMIFSFYRRKSARPKYHEVAVVLLHGYLSLWRHAYWQGLLPLRRALASSGVPIVIASAPRTGDVAARAARVACCLNRLPHRRLVLVGHSMGGLDARYVASRLDPERRVRQVITIGTPHRGTTAAEWVLRRGCGPTSLLRLIDGGALRDLTRDGARRLERAMPDRPDVCYRAILGVHSPTLLPEPFREIAAGVTAQEGDNDGLVSSHSAARWAAPVSVPAHHLALIGLPLQRGLAWRPPAMPAQIPMLSRLVLGGLVPGT